MGKPYRICPDCGAALDPNEICDCQDPTYLAVSDVAARWSVSVDLVYNLVRRGSLGALKLGSTWRVPLSAVLEYEQTNSNQSKIPAKRPKRKPVLRV